jgi:hypothetical protein
LKIRIRDKSQNEYENIFSEIDNNIPRLQKYKFRLPINAVLFELLKDYCVFAKLVRMVSCFVKVFVHPIEWIKEPYQLYPEANLHSNKLGIPRNTIQSACKVFPHLTVVSCLR